MLISASSLNTVARCTPDLQKPPHAKKKVGEFLRGHTDQRSRSKNKIKGAFHVLIKGQGGVGSRQHNILQLRSTILDLPSTRLGETSRKTTFSVNEELRLYFLLVVVVRKFNNLS